jgi:hypothetical protein
MTEFRPTQLELYREFGGASHSTLIFDRVYSLLHLTYVHKKHFPENRHIVKDLIYFIQNRMIRIQTLDEIVNLVIEKEEEEHGTYIYQLKGLLAGIQESKHMMLFVKKWFQKTGIYWLFL